jgi:Tol biopolymer transport system component
LGRRRARLWLAWQGGSEPRWTPDGRRIVYAQCSPMAAGFSRLWSMRPDGRDRRLLSGKLNVSGCSFALSPDGRRIAFAADARPGALDLYVERLDGSARRLQARNVVGDVAWSSRGTISFRRSTKRGISLEGIAPGGTHRVYVVRRRCDVSGAVWSPNGRLFAIAQNFCHRQHVLSQIWVESGDGRNRHPVTKVLADAYLQRWSRNGRSLLYSRRVHGRWLLIRSDLSGKRAQILLRTREPVVVG